MIDVDPTQATTLEELAECLRQLHIRADKPTYRVLEQQTKHDKSLIPGTVFRRVRLGRSTVSDVLAARKFPGKAFLLTFVDACGVDLEADRRWEEAWDRLAMQRMMQPTGQEIEPGPLRINRSATSAATAADELTAPAAEADIADTVQERAPTIADTREELERKIDDLRAFESEHRSRLKTYLEGQLRNLEAGVTDSDTFPTMNSTPQTEEERRVAGLRAFESEYRSRLKAYLEGQLRDVDAPETGFPVSAPVGVPVTMDPSAPLERPVS